MARTASYYVDAALTAYNAFLRTFFYLRGELTPLLVIIAAAEELARRKEAA